MNALERSAERVTGDLKRIIRDSEELLHTTTDAIGMRALEARERLATTLKAAKATCQELQDKALASAKSADHLVRRNPYPTIGIALAAGLAAGLLLKRR